MPLTREQILSADDTAGKLEEVEVPEWGGSVYVRVMTGTLRDRFEAAFASDKTNIRARLAAYTLCDQAVKALFSEADVVELGNRSSVALDRVFAVAMRVNAIGPKDVDDLEKNSGTIPSGSTASASPAALVG